MSLTAPSSAGDPKPPSPPEEHLTLGSMAESLNLPGVGAGIPVRDAKNPIFAAGLSLLFPGLGQVYNGQTGKGILVLLGVLAGLLVMLIPGVAVWLFGVYDAYATARRMNTGTISFREMRWISVVLFMIVWTIGVLVFLALLAFAAFAAFTAAL
jgi:TM2 domain-containing membrane protein YozV